MPQFDVIVVGAGLSGIGFARRLQTTCPERSFQIFERRERVGGTWDLFRYPGIRSDSDIYTLGYSFKPWKGRDTIAAGEDIREYIEEASREYGIEPHIRFSTTVTAVSFDSDTDVWTVSYERGGKTGTATAGFVYFASGYYSYDAGYTPRFEGIESFGGTVVHPQFWPEDLDYAGKKVVVIGSGATAITLIPSMADDAELVTMLQRSPTYVFSRPGQDALTSGVRKVLPARLANDLVRFGNAAGTLGLYQLCRRAPKLSRALIRRLTKAQLPEGYPVDVHFKPAYAPWDQRLCVVPDGDLFRAIRRGKAAVVTDTIDRIDETGIVLGSGEHLDADIIVTATGLQMLALGGVSIDVDGERVDPGTKFIYRGHMLDGVPNLAWCIGYTNASWTLRADITARAVCDLLNHMAGHDYTRAQPSADGDELVARPALDLASGYIQRAAGHLPKAADKAPWMVRQNYFLDTLEYHRSDVTDHMVFSRAPATAVRKPEAAA